MNKKKKILLRNFIGFTKNLPIKEPKKCLFDHKNEE